METKKFDNDQGLSVFVGCMCMVEIKHLSEEDRMDHCNPFAQFI